MVVFADNFLTGAILSLLMPVTLLSVIWVWYWYAAKRVSKGGSRIGGQRDAAGETPTTTPQPQGGPQPGGTA